ncbi:MAG: hypothetical protein GX046_05065 [Tissierellia bacterium]|nr:hypothetical protein [Tissierellia bacterium]
MKKTFVLIFLLLLCAQSFSFAEEKRNWNLLILEGEELEEAELQGLVFNKSTASLKLAKKNDEGSFTFPPMDMEPFEYLVLSWNALTPQEASVELEARFYHEQEQQWSTWFSWGLWQKSPKRHSYSDEDKYGQLSYDTAWVLGDKATANKVQVRGVLKGKDVSLRRIALTTLNTMVTEGPVNKEAHPGKVLGELAYSQQIRHPFMAQLMCSANTTATQIGLLGEDLLPEEVALNSYDSHLEGYGNWAFNVAFAGEAGYKSYLSYADEEELLNLLDQGYPLGMSVAYSNVPGGSLPYLEGAPLTTGGHLITLRGYEWQDDELYFIASDSAAESDEKAKISYKSSQLMQAWKSRIVYVIEPREKVEASEIKRLPLTLSLEEDGLARLGGPMPLEIGPTFTAQPLKEPGRGLLAYTLEGEQGIYYNASLSKDGLVKFPRGTDIEKINLYLMTNLGLTYVAQVKVGKVADANYYLTLGILIFVLVMYFGFKVRKRS